MKAKAKAKKSKSKSKMKSILDSLRALEEKAHRDGLALRHAEVEAANVLERVPRRTICILDLLKVEAVKEDNKGLRVRIAQLEREGKEAQSKGEGKVRELQRAVREKEAEKEALRLKIEKLEVEGKEKDGFSLALLS